MTTAVSGRPEGLDLELAGLLSKYGWSATEPDLVARVQELLKKGAKVWNPSSSPGPLDYVIGKPSVVQLLLDNGALPKEQTLRAALRVDTPQRYSTELIRRLIDAKATVNESGMILLNAINRGHPADTLRLLINAGEVVTEAHLQKARSKEPQDAAVVALLQQALVPAQREFRDALLTGKNVSEIERLLYNKAKPEQPDPLTNARGDLERAICNYPTCSVEVIRLLIEHGAKPRPPGKGEPGTLVNGTLVNALLKKCPEDIIHSLHGQGERLGHPIHLDIARENGYSPATLQLLNPEPAPQNDHEEGRREHLRETEMPSMGWSLFGCLSSCFGGIWGCIRSIFASIAGLLPGSSVPDEYDPI